MNLSGVIRHPFRYLSIRAQIYQAGRRIVGHQAEESLVIYDDSPDSFPAWYHQEMYAAGQPLRDAVREEQKLISKLKRELDEL